MADSKKENMVRCRILRDRWDEDGKRHPKGTEIEIPAEAAMDGMETGALERVKK